MAKELFPVRTGQYFYLYTYFNTSYIVYIRSYLDGSLLNLQWLLAHMKTLKQLIQDLWFANNAALVAHIESVFRYTYCFPEAALLFELEVSLQKTEVFHQPAPQKEYYSPHITIGTTKLKVVHPFSYLSHQKLRSTMKSITGWHRKTVHLANYINACGTINT